MPLFCFPTGSTKSKKSSNSKASEHSASKNNNHSNDGQHQQHISNNNNNNNNTNSNSNNSSNNNDPSLTTSTLFNRHLLRYVTNEFHAKVRDELTVMPDDVVLFEYEDPTGEWSHVWSIRVCKSGYVPSKILTELKQISPTRKKKMPRNCETSTRMEVSSRHSHHNNSHHHVSGQAVSTNGDNSRLSDHPICGHNHHHHHLSNVPQSFQGSASNQTFSKFHSEHHIGLVDGPATYYNLRAPNGHCESYNPPFLTSDHGQFVVTNQFVARQENDLDVQVGDIVRVLNNEDKDWYWVRRECDNGEGFVPANRLRDRSSIDSVLLKGSTISTAAVPTYSNQMETYMPE